MGQFPQGGHVAMGMRQGMQQQPQMPSQVSVAFTETDHEWILS